MQDLINFSKNNKKNFFFLQTITNGEESELSHQMALITTNSENQLLIKSH